MDAHAPLARVEDLGVESYSAQITTLKNEIILYAEANGRKDILDRANKLMEERGDLKSDLSMILLLLKEDQTL